MKHVWLWIVIALLACVGLYYAVVYNSTNDMGDDASENDNPFAAIFGIILAPSIASSIWVYPVLAIAGVLVFLILIKSSRDKNKSHKWRR